jgi:protein-disulfide isomerase
MSPTRRLTVLALIASTLSFTTACDQTGAEDRKTVQAETAARDAKAGSTTTLGLTPAGADSALTLRADAGRLQGSGAMWVVMISDYQCPYCKSWHDSSMARLERDYVKTGKIRFAYLHLPLESIHPHARAESEAAMCAAAQGKFWSYSNALFAAQGTVRTMNDVSPLLTRIAREQALDMTEFSSCRQSPAIRSLVEADIRQAAQAGVQSTPSFVVGEFMLRGAVPYPDFAHAIDTALVVFKQRTAAQAGGKPSPGR